MRSRILSRLPRLSLGLLTVAAATASVGTAKAQSSNTSKPMPNVLLLVDTSGSMERMPDNSLPSANRDPLTGGTLVSPAVLNRCSPGVASNPNRWGMLVQALTGNMQPFFSCQETPRTANSAFTREYRIAGNTPYDTDYFLPYHRPLTGDSSLNNVCVTGPHKLPGAAMGNGVGLGHGYTGTTSVTDFPDDAIISVRQTYHATQYATTGLPLVVPDAQTCIFDQTPDGQLDAARDYVRFALMTFDTDTEKGIGVNGGVWPPSNGIQTGGTAPNWQPFAGQWSYLRDGSNPDYGASFNTAGSGGQGKPDLCPTFAPFEVGARHWGAPPWEGRMVPFPASDASLYDIQKTNEQIQRVLLSSRPYGATPIDGMLDDAKDYYWYNGQGNAPKNDPYVNGTCREQYIVLLTDGAPNLDLRPSCGTTGAGTGIGVCPYPRKGWETAYDLYQGTGGRRVKTFVIGFSVNGSGTTPYPGDGFPTGFTASPNNNCKAWYNGVGATPAAMAAACASAPADASGNRPPAGTTAEACCKLNELAFNGSGGLSGENIGPFFAESQADIVLAFGKILGAVTHTASTRTLPGFTPTAYSSFGTGATTGQFIATFIPNAQKPWSGELDRQRYRCGTASGTLASDPLPQSVAQGDYMSANLAAQGAANRLFFTVVGDTISVSPAVGSPPSTILVDSSRTIRPFVPAAADGIPTYSGLEVAGVDFSLRTATNFSRALDIDDNTCKATKGIRRGASVGARGTVDIPPLATQSCTDAVWGFLTAHSLTPITRTGKAPYTSVSYDFNVRCANGGSTTQGSCSITGDSCTVGAAGACASLPGQVCVPECTALGAIYRSTPTIVGPPDGFLRDEGFRTFQAKRRNRRPATFVQTTDGILHAFKAIEETAGAHHELWSFIPPAILPRLASNYPAGNQVLLDGTPAVRETVWDRTVGDTDSSAGTPPGAKWHTSLVASLGVEAGGYYGLNVTDVDCNAAAGVTTGECTGASGYQQPAQNLASDVGAGAEFDGGAKRGPHFLWQLSDFVRDGVTDPAKVIREARNGDRMVALFGRQTGTPAIATLQIRSGVGPERQVGVAILPGGIDGTPVTNGSCARGGADLANDTAYPPRNNVRQWGANCSTSPVPGRGITIVRLDNGQIIRHFGRTQDTPRAVANSGAFTATQFDSPMTGTPVVYPQTVGAVAQKIFVGDADGTLWRIDVSSTNPANWRVHLFADLLAVDGNGAADSEPVAIPPTLTLDPNGALVVNAATGDQESLIRKTGDRNYVWSIRETRPGAGAPPIGSVQWFLRLNNGERVTGPMVVFERSLYLATFEPRIPVGAANCSSAGVARLWGLDYLTPGTGAGLGGAARWCSLASLGADGVCSGGYVRNEDISNQVIPGVSLRATQACGELNNLADESGGTGYAQFSPSQYNLFFGIGKASGASGAASTIAARQSIRLPIPRTSSKVDAWSFIID